MWMFFIDSKVGSAEDVDEEDVVIVESKPHLMDQYAVIMGPTLLDMSSRTTGKVMIMNPFDQATSLKQDSVVGIAESILGSSTTVIASDVDCKQPFSLQDTSTIAGEVYSKAQKPADESLGGLDGTPAARGVFERAAVIDSPILAGTGIKHNEKESVIGQSKGPIGVIEVPNLTTRESDVASCEETGAAAGFRDRVDNPGGGDLDETLIPEHLRDLYERSTEGKTVDQCKAIAELLVSYQSVFSKK